jgi:two-component system sensor histidine kinase ChiS
MKLLHSIVYNINTKAKEKEYQYIIYGIFSFTGFVSFYFFNYQHDLTAYESIPARAIAVFLSFSLIIKDFWPKALKKYLPFFWNITITYNLPFFCTFMLLKNGWTPHWQMTELMALTILTIITDVMTLLIIAPIGITLASFLYFITTNDPVFPNNILGVVINYLTVFVFCALFTFNKDKFFQEKVRFHNKIQELNNSLEQKVKTRTIELEQALSAKTEFLNNMSHEIRTPIQGFTTISEGLVSHWNKFSEEKKLQLATQVASSAKRLGSLVGNLLDLSKFNASKMIMSYSPLELNRIVNEIIDECNELYLNNKNVKINFTTSLQDTLLQADEGRIAQVIRNLFANAIKFTPNNGFLEASLIQTKLYSQEAIQFTLKDSGMGIPKNELESIFEPFTQSSLTKTKAGGTGLGLTICRHIINAHNGKIWAENNKEESGSSFHFIIPVIQRNIRINKEASDNIPPSKKANIIIIDDEEICLSSMELLLLSTHHFLVKKSSGYEGLQYIKDHPNEIDIILLDLMMPDIDGITVLESIKQDPKLSKIPVILQSGTSDQTEIQKAYAIGIVSFIHKPYKKDAVLKAINQALELKAT